MKALIKRLRKIEAEVTEESRINENQDIREGLKKLSTEELRKLKGITQKINGDKQKISDPNNGPMATGANRVDYSMLTDGEAEDLMRISRKVYGNSQ